MFILSKKTAHSALKMPQSAFIGSSSYGEALKRLNELQSNADYIKQATQVPSRSTNKLEVLHKYLLRCGVTPSKMKKLSVIHIAGTKGKGSTCAFLEHILRNHGYRTGFFSSPHLVTVRERIRINGFPISEQEFVHHFFQIHDLLQKAKEDEHDVPAYFAFLTIVMISVFLSVNVDVAIVEVGIGGEYDSTNVIQNTVCAGITSLGLDHTSLLGNSLSEIAFHKSGIFKPGAIAFTVPQPEEAMNVLKQRAIEKRCSLHIVPPLESHKWKDGPPNLGIQSKVQYYNASLAMHLAATWMRADNKRRTKHFDLEKVATALSSCKWPGRTQNLKSKSADFFLDGAHTVESIQHCKAWYKSIVNDTKGDKILIFNITGQRNGIRLLCHLKDLDFCKAYFVPNYSGTVEDRSNTTDEIIEEQKIKCKQYSEFWGDGSILANSVLDILHDIRSCYGPSDNLQSVPKPQVLVTGSLHLVGAVLAALDPHLTMQTDY